MATDGYPGSRLRRTLRRVPGLRKGVRAVRRRRHQPSPWESLAQQQSGLWAEARQRSESGPRVLIATSMGGFQQGVLLESALAVALTLRGAQVDVLLCDSFLPACQLTEIAQVTPDRLTAQRVQSRCDSCQSAGEAVFKPLGLPVYRYGRLVQSGRRRQARRTAGSIIMDAVREHRLDGLAVGEHAFAGALRYFARGNLDGEHGAEDVVRRYVEAALLSAYAIQELLQRNRYDVACFNHGLYVPQGLVGEVCRQRGVRLVTWNPAYRRHRFIFSHGDTYHHTMISEPEGEWENLPWTPGMERDTIGYLTSRRRGTRDWIWFHDEPQEDAGEIARDTGLDFSRPCIAMLTNVMWDAQLHYSSNAFPSMLEWVIQTIRYFENRPELQLAIRVHPAEIRGSVPSRQPIVSEIERAIPTLPPNVFVIPPESQISTYALVEQCNSAIIYNTKTGIEIASMGIPVIVAGEAWIRNKGFSLDASSPDEYFRILDRLPLLNGLTVDEQERARKYAYHFFFRRMIPLPFISPAENSRFNLELRELGELRPGTFPGLDVVCDGILNGSSFVFPAEATQHVGATA